MMRALCVLSRVFTVYSTYVLLKYAMLACYHSLVALRFRHGLLSFRRRVFGIFLNSAVVSLLFRRGMFGILLASSAIHPLIPALSTYHLPYLAALV